MVQRFGGERQARNDGNPLTDAGDLEGSNRGARTDLARSDRIMRVGLLVRLRQVSRE